MAQDDQGNVWSLGEYPEEHEDGEVSAPSTWLAGHHGATAGVLMQAHPMTKTPAYIQGRAPDIEFFDKAKVAQTNQKVCVPVDCYSGVLVVDEWDPTAQPEDGHQFKYHAPGVGIIQVTAKGGDEQETLVATEHRQLTPEELAAADARALELDTQAYTLAKAVYGSSEPAVVCPLPAAPPPTTPPPPPTTPPVFPSRSCPAAPVTPVAPVQKGF
jgi:hypothetical protein